jgi:hypothetical protein
MKKRLTAAVMLASLAFCSVPAAFASSLQPAAPTALAPSSRHDHSCCPGARSQFAAPLFSMPAPATIPCGDQHPCCTKPAPGNPAFLPAANNTVRPGLEAVVVTTADRRSDGRATAAQAQTVIRSSLIPYEAQSFASEPSLARRNSTRSKQFDAGVVCWLSDRARARNANFEKLWRLNHEMQNVSFHPGPDGRVLGTNRNSKRTYYSPAKHRAGGQGEIL